MVDVFVCVGGLKAAAAAAAAATCCKTQQIQVFSDRKPMRDYSVKGSY